MGLIKKVWAEVINDSRGDPTIQVSVQDDKGKIGVAAVPSGASKSNYEAAVVEPLKAQVNIESEIAPRILGRDPTDQSGLDDLLIKLDGTPDKQRLGGNTILGVSLSVARLAANQQKLPLYHWIGQLANRSDYFLPIPMFNLINGGMHAENNLDFQEFMIVPDLVRGYHNQLSAGSLIFNTLGDLLRGSATYLPTGDEGGYAPNMDTNEIAFGELVKAIRDSGYQPWDEVSLALDAAATGLPATFELTVKRYLGLFRDFPILSLEDPFNEDDWEKWIALKSEMDELNSGFKKLMLVGDDLFATNLTRLKEGITRHAANAILIKLNQIGTISETISVAELAKDVGMIQIVSHRSGETLDDFIADFAVGIGAQFIKTGAPNEHHPERMAKYRRLLKIEQDLSGVTSNLQLR
ncbi:MAG: phosphopyruvate hydratase [Patescibacteria group bacterium]